MEIENKIIRDEKKEFVDETNTFRKIIPWNKNLEVRKRYHKIIELYRNKLLSTKEIGNIFGCGEHIIYDILKENNLMMTRSERRNRLIEIGKIKIWNKRIDIWDKSEEIINLYRGELMNTKEIAEIIGCNYSLIKQILRKNNAIIGQSERRKILAKTGKLKMWNDGLTKETDERVKNGILKMTKWKEKNIKNKIYEEIYGVERAKGIKLKNSHSNSIAKIGEKNPMYGKSQTEKWKKMRAQLILPFKDTKIEVKIQEFLTKLHLEYFAHKYMSKITHSYQCDILIPVQKGIIQKTIIECDGCYWHGCPICNKKIEDFQKEQIEKDRIRTKELIERGFRVIRLWEHDIKPMELNDFEEKLKIV